MFRQLRARIASRTLDEDDVQRPVKEKTGHYSCPDCGAEKAVHGEPSPRPDTPTPSVQRCYKCNAKLKTPRNILSRERELHANMRRTGQWPGQVSESRDDLVKLRVRIKNRA